MILDSVGNSMLRDTSYGKPIKAKPTIRVNVRVIIGRLFKRSPEKPKFCA
jgi:hypothetical protein